MKNVINNENASKSGLLVSMPTEKTKRFCIESVIKAVISLTVPPDSSFLITTGSGDPIASYVETIFKKHGFGNFANCKLKRLRYIKDRTIWDSEGFTPLTLQRNLALNVAHHFGFNQLMYIDSDVEVPSDTYVRLNFLDSDVAGGYYESRFFQDQAFIGTKLADGSIKIPKQGVDYNVGDILTVDYTGLGCSLFSRDVLSKVRFPIDPYVAEDIAFFNKIIKMGYTTKIDTGVRCKHHSLFDSRISAESQDHFTKLAWAIYNGVGDYIIKDEVIDSSEISICEGVVIGADDLPSIVVKMGGKYSLVYRNPDESLNKSMNAYVFIPRSTTVSNNILEKICDDIA